jgi:hypothetical protein
VGVIWDFKFPNSLFSASPTQTSAKVTGFK